MPQGRTQIGSARISDPTEGTEQNLITPLFEMPQVPPLVGQRNSRTLWQGPSIGWRTSSANFATTEYAADLSSLLELVSTPVRESHHSYSPRSPSARD